MEARHDPDRENPIHDAYLCLLMHDDALRGVLDQVFGGHLAVSDWDVTSTPLMPVSDGQGVFRGLIDLDVRATRRITCTWCQELLKSRPGEALCRTHQRLRELATRWSLYDATYAAGTNAGGWSEAHERPTEARPVGLDGQIEQCPHCTLRRDRRCPDHGDTLIVWEQGRYRTRLQLEALLAVDVRATPVTATAIVQDLRPLQQAEQERSGRGKDGEAHPKAWAVVLWHDAPEQVRQIITAAGIPVVEPPATLEHALDPPPLQLHLIGYGDELES